MPISGLHPRNQSLGFLRPERGGIDFILFSNFPLTSVYLGPPFPTTSAARGTAVCSCMLLYHCFANSVSVPSQANVLPDWGCCLIHS